MTQNEEGKFCAKSTGSQQSSRIASIVGANGFILIPSAKDHGNEFLPAGTFVPCYMFD